jgi:hypothetical protein
MPSTHRNFNRWHLDPSARGGVRNLLERATPASCALFVQIVKEYSEASDARRVGLSLHRGDKAEDRSFNEAARELEQRFSQSMNLVVRRAGMYTVPVVDSLWYSSPLTNSGKNGHRLTKMQAIKRRLRAWVVGALSEWVEGVDESTFQGSGSDAVRLNANAPGPCEHARLHELPPRISAVRARACNALVRTRTCTQPPTR